MKKVIVLGGGTAGWLTALLTREFYPQFDITLVESEQIGILGAGEGTVPHFVSLLDFLRIPVSALVKECKASVKAGIRFTNWHGDGTSYFHQFAANDDLEMWPADAIFRFNVLATALIARNVPLDGISFMAGIAAQGKVPFLLNDLNDYELKNYRDPLFALQHLGSFALHFDARLLAAYLGQVGQFQRGIERVEGRFQKAENDAEGNIVSISLENGKTLKCDFIFDCSGFARLLLGKHFNQKWIEYKEHLPLDSALPFFIPHDGSVLPPCTEAIAMKYGWMWKIPVQDRYGCGYVFDSSHIDEEQARGEVEAMLGHAIESPRTFRFQAGGFEKVLVKNCMGVGLSQNFVEPLEATSIWVFTKYLVNFLKSGAIHCLTPEVEDTINRQSRRILDPIPEFLALHYLTERQDTEFWRRFSIERAMPSLREKLRLWEQTPLFDDDAVHLEMFKPPSWIAVGDGVRAFNRESFRRVASLHDQARINHHLEALIRKQRHVSRACMNHGDFLAFLREH